MHHSIVVTSLDAEEIERLHRIATEIFAWVSPISPPAVNGYCSFFVPPDGSREGFDESFLGDARRDVFIHDCLSNVGPDCAWVEVQYGEEDRHHVGDAVPTVLRWMS